MSGKDIFESAFRSSPFTSSSSSSSSGAPGASFLSGSATRSITSGSFVSGPAPSASVATGRGAFSAYDASGRNEFETLPDDWRAQVENVLASSTTSGMDGFQEMDMGGRFVFTGLDLDLIQKIWYARGIRYYETAGRTQLTTETNALSLARRDLAILLQAATVRGPAITRQKLLETMPAEGKSALLNIFQIYRIQPDNVLTKTDLTVARLQAANAVYVARGMMIWSNIRVIGARPVNLPKGLAINSSSGLVDFANKVLLGAFLTWITEQNKVINKDRRAETEEGGVDTNASARQVARNVAQTDRYKKPIKVQLYAEMLSKDDTKTDDRQYLAVRTLMFPYPETKAYGLSLPAKAPKPEADAEVTSFYDDGKLPDEVYAAWNLLNKENKGVIRNWVKLAKTEEEVVNLTKSRKSALNYRSMVTTI